jgi:hypothetical protein
MKTLLVALGLAVAVGGAVAGSTSGCTVTYPQVAPGWYAPGYYSANGYASVYVAPGIRAYQINGYWHTYNYGLRTWSPYGGSVVYRGRVYAPRARVYIRR